MKKNNEGFYVLIIVFQAIAIWAIIFANWAKSDNIPPVTATRIFVEVEDGQFAGSGVLVRSDLVITNWHVVRDRGGKIQVLFSDWTVHEAEVIKEHKDWDLAALRINPVSITPIEFGDAPEVGDLIKVGGYGFGWYESKEGKLLKYYGTNIIQIDTRVRNGDSGGLMLNSDNKLVGILFGSRDDGTYGSQIDYIKKFLEDIE